MKSEARLMSTAPSYPLVKVLWSTTTLVEAFSMLIASSSQSRKDRFWITTFLEPLKVRPQPSIVAPELPRMDLFDPTLSMPEQEMVPETRITAAVVPLIAELSADAEVTV